ncbi:MAG: YARHG domain-containing protein [Candidatus Riflebacteria bacterium]|nr:YARHG domain-containing protein [Candidatus Riflebacteria bacterium]
MQRASLALVIAILISGAVSPLAAGDLGETIIGRLMDALKAARRPMPPSFRYDGPFEEGGRSFHLVTGGENRDDHYVNTAWYHVDARTGEVFAYDVVSDKTTPTGLRLDLGNAPATAASPGTAATAPATGSGSAAGFPDLAAVDLAEADLRAKPARELDLLRNSLYARHGYIFKKADLQQVFAGQPWYRPVQADAAVVEKAFSARERRNLDLIMAVQKGQAPAAAVSPAPAAQVAEFIDDEGNVRDGPATQRRLLFTPARGSRAGLLERQGEWLKLSFTGQPVAIGWTHQKNVRLVTAAPAATTDIAEFIDDEGNVRDGPATQRRLLFTPPRGTRATILERQGEWLKLAFTGQPAATGWTHRKNVRFLAGNAAQAGAAQAGAAQAGAAQAGPPAAAGADPLAAFEANGHRVRERLDLDGDGTPEEISLRPAGHDPAGDATRFHLVVEKVTGTSRQCLWEDTANEFPFVIADFGVEDLAAVGDLDGDGRIEIVSTEPASDVSPVRFRLLRWDGKRFVLVRRAFLVAPGTDAEGFRWQDAEPPAEAPHAWLYSIKSPEPGRPLSAWSYWKGEATEVAGRFGPDGFHTEEPGQP